jgi:hypothetical protein
MPSTLISGAATSSEAPKEAASSLAQYDSPGVYGTPFPNTIEELAKFEKTAPYGRGSAGAY